VWVIIVGMKNVITYGSFDLLHYGHIELLRRAKELTNGGKLYVGLSSESFNKIKGKTTYLDYIDRKRLLESIKFVDKVFPETNWGQKEKDVARYKEQFESLKKQRDELKKQFNKTED
jgi:glycerol-3-phosphate cytidylyltransferase